MTEKRKTWLVVRVANWAASVPGTIQDWKAIAMRAGSGGVVTTASLTPQAKGAAMDNPGWAYWGFVALVMLVTIWSIVRHIDGQRKESQKEARRARQEGERKAERERARAAYDRIVTATHRIAAGDSYSKRVDPDEAVKIIQAAAPAIATEFMRTHPEGLHGGTPQVDREMLMRWLVTGREAEAPFPRLTNDADEASDDAPNAEA